MCNQEAMLLEKKLSQLADQEWILRGRLGGDVALPPLELGASPRTIRRTPNFYVRNEKDWKYLLQEYGFLSSNSKGEKKDNTTTTKDTSSSPSPTLSRGSVASYRIPPTGRSDKAPRKKRSSIAKRRRLVSGDLFCSETLPPVSAHERTWWTSEMLSSLESAAPISLRPSPV